jgi:hypothetical protein
MPLKREVGLVMLASEKTPLKKVTATANSDSRTRMMKEGCKGKGRNGLERIDFAGYSINDIDLLSALVPAYPCMSPPTPVTRPMVDVLIKLA